VSAWHNNVENENAYLLLILTVLSLFVYMIVFDERHVLPVDVGVQDEEITENLFYFSIFEYVTFETLEIFKQIRMFFQCIFKLIQIFLWVSQQILLIVLLNVILLSFGVLVVLKQLLLVFIYLIQVYFGLFFK
jgi:hypothetical protein